MIQMATSETRKLRKTRTERGRICRGENTHADGVFQVITHKRSDAVEDCTDRRPLSQAGRRPNITAAAWSGLRPHPAIYMAMHARHATMHATTAPRRQHCKPSVQGRTAQHSTRLCALLRMVGELPAQEYRTVLQYECRAWPPSTA